MSNLTQLKYAAAAGLALAGVSSAEDANAQTFGGGSFGVQDCSQSTSSGCGTNTPPVSPPCETLSNCGGDTPPTTPPPVDPGNPVDVTTTNTNTNTNTK